MHIACQHHDSTDVIEYLIGLHTLTLDALDRDGNSALHYACRGAKYDTIALLLEKYDALSVSKRNDENKLPIDLLWESNVVNDKEEVAYTESVFRLLQAHPSEMIMSGSMNMKQHVTSRESAHLRMERRESTGIHM